jgi:hypothetical protein
MGTHSFYMIVRSRAQYSEMAEIVKNKANIFFDAALLQLNQVLSETFPSDTA